MGRTGRLDAIFFLLMNAACSCIMLTEKTSHASKPSDTWDAMGCLFSFRRCTSSEPSCYTPATYSLHWYLWDEAIQSELSALEKNQAWEDIPTSAKKKVRLDAPPSVQTYEIALCDLCVWTPPLGLTTFITHVL